MKRFIALFLSASIMTTSVFASEITVVLDGTEVEFSSQEPVIVEGRTLIPLRGVFEQLGYEISWEADTKTATFSKEGSTIDVTADSGVFIMNGDEISLEVPASIINGSMMLPLRAVGEAAGLAVDWDSDTKTVSLASGNSEEETVQAAEAETESKTEAQTEAVTEEETETTTAATVIEDDIPSADLEALKVCANSTSTILSIDVLDSLLDETLEYAYYKIDGALEYSYSAKELSEVFDDAITECKGYKAAANNLKTLTEDQTIVKRFIIYVDLQIDTLQFYYDCFCTSKYDSLTNLDIQTKIDNLKRDLSDSIDDVNSSYKTLANSVNKTSGIEKYNGAVNENLSAAKKAEMENYRKEIGEYVSEQLNKEVSESDTYKTGSAFVTAASNIKNKINSTKTPTQCMFDKQRMLRACELLSQAGTAVKNGAYTKDGKNQYYIEYLAVLIPCNILFEGALGDYYDITSEDFEDVTDEVEIDPNAESIVV